MDIYELDPFCLNNGVLLHGSEPLALGRRAIALLQALIEKPGALVSKDVLIEAAWPRQAVEDSNLPVQIAALRRALGKAPGGDRWIETMPRRGYRFIGPVVVREENSVTAAPPQVAPPQDAAPIWHDEAERRQVSALSCELVGVEAGAGCTSLEDLRETIGDFQRCVSETAARHAGVIYRHLGNNLLVLFGYPEAHEHDAEQAIRAGLELCVAMPCRVGIATGMVIIGDPVGGGALRDREIVGDVPNLAARLLASAQPDTVAIDRVTRRLIGNLFDCRDLGALPTNSDTEPTRRWQVLRESNVASRFEALRGSKSTRLVGRDEEIDLLLHRWAHAKAGDGQIILVSGEAGIGKSRITAAFEERLHAEPHLRLRYFCSPYHQDSALFPVIDQLGRAAGFARDDPPASKLQKLEALLARAAPPDEDIALLAELMSLPASERHPLPNLSPQRKKGNCSPRW
jgi:DNA-binding winged helix-turn-helix (wHTH) protein